jgi:Protein of unknown function (DUF3987)
MTTKEGMGVMQEQPLEPDAAAPSGDWPHLADEALLGLAGDIVHSIDPFTEADPVAVLIHILAGFGNVIGSGPHFRVEYTTHPPRLFAVICGDSAKGRKGQSWSTPKHLLTRVAPLWAEQIVSGLSTGEGLIYKLRDPAPAQGDRGATDKRLFVVEEEFAQAFKVMKRDGNILSVTIRDAWDHGTLSPLTKTNPIKATDAHVSIVGHITKQELLKYMTATEQGNGFANRFLWIAAKRSKMIPTPTGVPPHVLEALVAQLQDSVGFSTGIGEVGRDGDAEALWHDIYPWLSEGKPGLLGAVVNRAEAQVMRLALVYALLDRSSRITAPHLRAGLALWRYAEDSARWIFGQRLGDPTADRIRVALQRDDVMDETDIRDLFHRNVPGPEIDRALAHLEALGLAKRSIQPTGGRPRIVWRPTT